MPKAERDWSKSERECLAIVWAVIYLRPYLEGTRITIWTDHNSLRWLLNMSEASSRLTRWRLRVAELDYKVTYRPGLKKQAAYAISPIPTDGTDQTPLKDEVPIIWKGPQNEENDLEDRDLVEKATIGHGKDNKPEVLMCTIAWEDPQWEVHLAETKAEVLTPVIVDELFHAHRNDDQCVQ